jgi:hypothetical protein
MRALLVLVGKTPAPRAEQPKTKAYPRIRWSYSPRLDKPLRGNPEWPKNTGTQQMEVMQQQVADMKKRGYAYMLVGQDRQMLMDCRIVKLIEPV